MSSDELNIFDIHGDEFKFLDYPNTFLSDDHENGELNKSANTQIEENLEELIKVTTCGSKRQVNGETKKTNYLDDLNDLKELKRIEDKKSYQQSLDRLSKLNLGSSTNYQSNYQKNFNSNYTSNQSTVNSSPSHNPPAYSIPSSYLNGFENRKLTYKFENKSSRAFKSKNHLTGEESEPSKLDATFDLRENDCEKTFLLNNKLLNLSGLDDDVNNTFVVAKNYDEVQEIARQQEATLKKNKNTFLPSTPTFNNATITKAKKNGHYSKLDQTVTLKHLINENFNDSIIKSPNLDGTFNLGNPMESPHNNGTIVKKEKSLPNSRSFILNQKNVTNVKRTFNKNNNLEPKNNRLNSSFIVGDINDVKKSTDDHREDCKTINLPNVHLPSSNQFSTITKNKINPNPNLKRTNTFKVREQYASEENLNLNFYKNGLNSNFLAKSGLCVNNYPSIDDMKNYETIKLNQRKFSKLNSKSNGSIHNHTFSRDQEFDDHEQIYFKNDSKLPAFTSRLKAPSRISVLKGSEEI